MNAIVVVSFLILAAAITATIPGDKAPFFNYRNCTHSCQEMKLIEKRANATCNAKCAKKNPEAHKCSSTDIDCSKDPRKCVDVAKLKALTKLCGDSLDTKIMNCIVPCCGDGGFCMKKHNPGTNDIVACERECIDDILRTTTTLAATSPDSTPSATTASTEAPR